MDTTNIISTYVKAEKEIPLDQLEIYPQESKKQLTLLEEKRICQICKQICSYAFTPVKDLGNDVTHKYILELNFSSTNQSIICSSCLDSLNTHRHLLENNSNVQDKITNISEENKALFCIKTEHFEVKSEEDSIENTHECNNESCADQISKNREIMHETHPMHQQPHDSKYNKSLVEQPLIHTDNCQVQMYECNRCSFSTKNKKYLTYHQLVHKSVSEVQMYSCDKCTYETKHKSSLNRHVLKHEDISHSQIYTCETCNYTTKFKRHFARHRLGHSSEPYKCQFCDFVTKDRKYLPYHELSHKKASEVPVYKCLSCSYESKNRRNFVRHRLVHKSVSQEQIFNCDQCSYTATQKRYVTWHQLKHKSKSEVVMYACDSCSYETKYKRYLAEHRMRHKKLFEVRMYECELCGYQNKIRKYVTRHKLKHRDDFVVPMYKSRYKCSACDFGTRSKKHLERHQHENHKNVSQDLKNNASPVVDKDNKKKAFKMDIDETMFPYVKSENEISLDQSKIHLEENKQDLRVLNLKTEEIEIKHEDKIGNMPGCDDKPCATQTSRNLQVTHKTEEEENNSEMYKHQCVTCDYKTNSKHNFNCHQLKHKNNSEVQMYNCDMCNFETKYTNSLTRHRQGHKTNSKEQMVKCLECNYETRNKKNLQQHQVAHREVQM